MPLYVCQQCGAIENTALGKFWGRQVKLCSECATGTWHGKFPKQTWAPKTHGRMIPGTRLLVAATVASPANPDTPRSTC